jgi:hypothetical protein
MLTLAIYVCCFFYLVECSVWSKQGTGINATDMFVGMSLAISSDGSSAIIGAPDDYYSKGAFGFFVKTADQVWTEQGKYVPSDAFSEDRTGMSLTMNADANVMAVSAEHCFWIFTHQRELDPARVEKNPKRCYQQWWCRSSHLHERQRRLFSSR